MRRQNYFMTSWESHMQNSNKMATMSVNIDETLFQKSLAFAAEEMKLPRGFKPQQCRAIKHVLEQKDVFVNLPTGESVCHRIQTLPP